MQTTDIILYLVMAAMLVVALALVLPTLVKKYSDKENDGYAEELSLALKEEARRLKLELREGKITQKEYEELFEDLKKRVVEETENPSYKFKKDTDKSRVIRVVVAVNIIFFLSIGLYWVLGAPEVIKLHKYQQVLEGVASTQDIETYLKDNSKDGSAWVLLAHKFVQEGKFDKAVVAYREGRNASADVREDLSIKIEMGAAIIASKDKKLFAEAKKLLEEVLKIEPENKAANQLLLFLQ